MLSDPKISKVHGRMVFDSRGIPTIEAEVILNNGVVLCDDYDLSYAPGVKKAIDEFVENNSFKSSIISCAFSDAFFMATILAECSEARASRTIWYN